MIMERKLYLYKLDTYICIIKMQQTIIISIRGILFVTE